MKDLIGTDRFGFERIFMQLLVPGLVALGPFIWGLYRAHADREGPLLDFIAAHEELALFFVFVFAIITGAIIEEISLRLEHEVIDRHIGRNDPNLKPIWYAYLQLRTQSDSEFVIMPDYNSNAVVRFKFTMSLSIALLFAAVGVSGLVALDHIMLQGVWRWLLPTTFFLGSGYLFLESIDTATTLHRNRIHIFQALEEVPLDYDDPDDPGKPEGKEEKVRYKLEFHGSGCCTAYRKFRKVGEHKDFYLVKAERRKPTPSDAELTRFDTCIHIDEDDVGYYHVSLLRELSKDEMKLG